MARTLTPEIVGKLLARPKDLIYSDNEMMFRTWTLGPVVDTRDATDSQRARGRALLKKVEKFTEGIDYRVVRLNHWLIGWVDHLTYRVLDTEGDPSSVTKIAKKMAKGDDS